MSSYKKHFETYLSPWFKNKNPTKKIPANGHQIHMQQKHQKETKQTSQTHKSNNIQDPHPNNPKPHFHLHYYFSIILITTSYQNSERNGLNTKLKSARRLPTIVKEATSSSFQVFINGGGHGMIYIGLLEDGLKKRWIGDE
ncbi:uncharacterized protein LOC127135390 [Lathyrus oleraceus]|uniref:uncharacterized protein LOC127135390 n=1 Tax=Pisum sativum TaxID=3888 RepID=UPI0021D36F70|nr:uncharacterized protein LOC127135390 [Pisum sativum]